MSLTSLIIQKDSHLSLSWGRLWVLLLSLKRKYWILRNLFVESLVCLSMFISYLSFSSYDFSFLWMHTCQVLFTWILVHSNQILQVQLTTTIFCRPWFCYKIEKGRVPMFAWIQKHSLFLIINVGHHLKRLWGLLTKLLMMLKIGW